MSAKKFNLNKYISNKDSKLQEVEGIMCKNKQNIKKYIC